MLASAFLFALLGLLIKLMGPHFRVWDIATFRFGGGFLLLLLFFGRRERLFHPARPRLILLRGLTGTVAFVALVLAIQQVSLSTAMIFFYSYPAFAALFAPLLFGDRVYARDLAWVFLALAGVTVLFDPHFGGSAQGQIMGVVAAVTAGLTVTLIRELRESHGPVIIYFYFCLVGGLVSLGPFLSDPRLPRSSLEWFMVAGIVATSIAAQLLMNQGFRYCKSWQGGLFMTSEVIYTTALGIVFLNESVGWRFWIGGFLVTGSALASHLRSRKAAAVPDAAAPRR
jgi:drug/metabolite transporter (DMT)-like permease